MARGTAIKEEDATGSAGEPKASKRRDTLSQADPRPQCDGGTPVCATCTAVYKTPCHYDVESESRRTKAGTKRDASVVASSSTPTPTNDNAEFLLHSIRTLPEADVNELIQHIRKDARLDVASLADTWRKTAVLPSSTPVGEPQSFVSELSMLLGKPAMTRSGESRYFGHTSNMSLVPEDEDDSCAMPRASSLARKSPTWTTITDDIGLVERLLDLYFRWSHSFYVVFSRECFYKDFRSGREKYCSSLLVNAMLAYGCHFTDDPAGRIDPDNFRTAGDHFFEEARRLLYENEASSLTTVQALCVMAMREPSAGRDSSGFAYMGRCMRMAIEMGLHLKNSAAPAMGLTPSEIEVRKVTFWGIFTVDTVWSICIGRISQLPRVAITLDKPILDEPPGGLHAEAYPGSLQVPPGTVTSRMFLQEFSSLSELINDNNYMFYAPSARLTDIKLINCHNKYLEWFRNLPAPLRLDDAQPQPHILVLHMLYHTAIGQLFRPMLKIDLINFRLKPRDACIEATNSVSELLRRYRSHYPMRTSQLVLTHILLSNCIVHLTFSKDAQFASSSYRYLVEGLQALEDMSVCHWFGGRAWKIIYETSKAWDLGFPEELRNSKLIPKAGTVAGTSESSIVVPRVNTEAAKTSPSARYNSIPSSAQPTRRESLSILISRRWCAPQPDSTSRVSPAYRAFVLSDFSYPPKRPLIELTTAPSTTAGSAETLFWNPLPHFGMGVPILPRNDYPVGPMALDNMLGNSNEWDRFSRDGFKMSETWNHDQANAFGGSGEEGYPQVSGDSDGFTNAEVAQFNGARRMPGHVSEVHQGGGQAFDASWWGEQGSMDR
ncbi:uncharacterized protein N0V89_002424 [Didymosphaeria variabile]|uniref:Xylanolytic transcriptional activator regulatory domain-containing protein n=1 Tax=Didymosphaeria variabile TaxID=1932322 RepID=A0A9W9CEM9_9PLEO|nr:uncharacterized protein N0V89_002424 [Didymosphaeria variabile]KAJ4357848.1 hypothetical protein N0V89_002424 [Didymosphaeria variabile]